MLEILTFLLCFLSAILSIYNLIYRKIVYQNKAYFIFSALVLVYSIGYMVFFAYKYFTH